MKEMESTGGCRYGGQQNSGIQTAVASTYIMRVHGEKTYSGYKVLLAAVRLRAITMAYVELCEV